MITLEQYFRDFKKTDEQIKNAALLLNRVNLLLSDAVKYGVILKINPKTQSNISGDTFGGFRPENCPQGAENSPHKEGMGIDIYDINNALDGWIDDIKLLKYDLYREHPEYTKGMWCHLQTRIPKSGRRTFIPY